MNALGRWTTLACLIGTLLLPLNLTAAERVAAETDNRRATEIATTITALTGIAISPLLGTGAYGAYHYFRTPAAARDQLPWFAQVKFWLPALLIVGAVAAKDALGATLPPGWKKPLDILETVENKFSGLVAAGAVVPITMSSIGDVLAAAPAGADGLSGSGLAMLFGLAVGQGFSLIDIVTVPVGIAIFAMVWMASHAINVLILLSPWGAIDAALKAARTGILGLLVLASNLDPWVGAAASLVLIVVSYFIAGWAFRLTIYGSICSWDFFTMRHHRFRVRDDRNRLFSAGKLKDVPPRTYGRLIRSGDSWVFRFRPWLVLPPREVPLPPARDLWLGRGWLFSEIEMEGGAVALLPPRYRGHEEEMAQQLGLTDIRDAGLRRAWSWIRETLGFGPEVRMRPA